MFVLAQQTVEVALDAAQVIGVLTGFLIPLLVGLLSKWRAPRWVKSVLNLGLSALSATLASVIPAEFSWAAFGLTFAATWATSIASYYGLLKPTGTAQAVQLRTANVGIGKRAA